MGYSPWGCKKLDTTETTLHARKEVRDAGEEGLKRKFLWDNLVCEGPFGLGRKLMG